MKHEPTKRLYGSITHTEFVSSDPDASRAWCSEVLGWQFKPSVATPKGDYHLFAYSDQGGGGIRRIEGSEVPASLPFVHVSDAREAFDKAIQAGAAEVTPPVQVMEGVTTAVVRAPGGFLVGFSGPSLQRGRLEQHSVLC